MINILLAVLCVLCVVQLAIALYVLQRLRKAEAQAKAWVGRVDAVLKSVESLSQLAGELRASVQSFKSIGDLLSPGREGESRGGSWAEILRRLGGK